MSEMLDRLDNERIFSIYKDGDGFIITEECDGYFEVRLKADELRRLAEEIIELSKSTE